MMSISERAAFCPRDGIFADDRNSRGLCYLDSTSIRTGSDRAFA